MRFRIFQYTLPAPPELDELNAFLASQRIAAVAHHIVPAGGASLLVFVVECAQGQAPRSASGAVKVDYRDEFSAEQFAVFSRLREQRKRWAEAEGLPVYALFTNAQLAELVRRRPASLADLGQIEGLGSVRVQKYGAILLELVKESHPPAPKV